MGLMKVKVILRSNGDEDGNDGFGEHVLVRSKGLAPNLCFGWDLRETG